MLNPHPITLNKTLSVQLRGKIGNIVQVPRPITLNKALSVQLRGTMGNIHSSDVL